jgi:2,4-dienoyl-CoA reductase-like NADH-dependent reductase (Old Yellow Enzyme family)
MAKLFEPLKIRDITLKNRIAVSPMCQYSSVDGRATDWHFSHLAARAVGGAGLVICEATAVEAVGRISPRDAGLWNDDQIEPLLSINRFMKTQGAVAGIQLAHAGRKASTSIPWEQHERKKLGKVERLEFAEGGWPVIAPSAIAFSENYPQPVEMSESDIKRVLLAFRESTLRAVQAEYQWVEIHAAHGYLAHEFLSPISNHRTDHYGGSFENRIRFTLELAKSVREVWPEKFPLAVRISATDWVDGGWNIEDSIALSIRLKNLGVDLIDCSSGGMVPDAKIPVGPNYQVPFAKQIRAKAGILTGAVGMITEAKQAEEILATGSADLILLARAMLRDPYWALHAAKALGATAQIPHQYGRAF